jgi:hypothetical protein
VVGREELFRVVDEEEEEDEDCERDASNLSSLS